MFQSSPVPKDRCNARWHPVRDGGRCFNPLRLRRAGAPIRCGRRRLRMAVSILSGSDGGQPTGRHVEARHTLNCFNPLRLRRAGAPIRRSRRRSRRRCRLLSFNPLRLRRAGADITLTPPPPDPARDLTSVMFQSSPARRRAVLEMDAYITRRGCQVVSILSGSEGAGVPHAARMRPAMSWGFQSSPAPKEPEHTWQNERCRRRPM